MLRQKSRVNTVSVNSVEIASLTKLKDLMITAFSCIGYIRDLFPEDSFKTSKCGDVKIKHLLKGSSPQADALLAWIENGCLEAIKKKYLKEVVFGIYEDEDKPNEMIETYTLRIAYPRLKDRNEVEIDRDDKHSLLMDKLFLESNVALDASSSQTESEEDQYAKTLRKIVKNLLCFTQTLQELPQKKFLTMQLHYFDNVTPEDYEPTGFKKASDAVSYISFASDPETFQFGKVNSGYHSVQFGVATTRMDLDHDEENDDKVEDNDEENDDKVEDNNERNDDKIEDNDADDFVDEEIVNGITKKQKVQQVQQSSSLSLPTATINDSELQRNGSLMVESLEEMSMVVPETDPNDIYLAKNLESIRIKNDSVNVPILKDEDQNEENGQEKKPRASQETFIPSSQASEFANFQKQAKTDDVRVEKSEAIISCCCDLNENDNDMIQCDECHKWQHTVCCGFFSNQDKRIPKHFVCMNCEYPKAPIKIERFIKSHCQMRRCLSIVYQEGIQSTIQLSRRVGFGLKAARSFLKRLITEGFLVNSSHKKYEAVKTAETRAKVKAYFLRDFDTLDDFKNLMRAEKAYSSQRDQYLIKNKKRNTIIYNTDSQPHQKRRKISVPESSITCE